MTQIEATDCEFWDNHKFGDRYYLVGAAGEWSVMDVPLRFDDSGDVFVRVMGDKSPVEVRTVNINNLSKKR